MKNSGYTSPELHAYASESWFTAEGARVKRRRLERAGLPEFKNWRFITLTMADHSGHPFEAYTRGKDRIRRFLSKFRKAIGVRFKWCWKLEFHEDGFAHWHLLIEHTRRIPVEMFDEVEAWWGLGRVNVRQVKGNDIAYVFKYVSKGIEGVPDWVSQHQGILRVFQASVGFYSNRVQRKQKQQEPRSCLLKVDLHTRSSWDAKKALLVTTNIYGERRVRAVKLPITFNALLLTRALESLHLGRQLADPGVVNISQNQATILEYENRRFAGLAGIPKNAAFAA